MSSGGNEIKKELQENCFTTKIKSQIKSSYQLSQKMLFLPKFPPRFMTSCSRATRRAENEEFERSLLNFKAHDKVTLRVGVQPSRHPSCPTSSRPSYGLLPVKV